MRITQILETTTAGSVATVAQPMMTQTRESVDVKGLKPVKQLMKGKSKNKGPYANSIAEGKVTEDDLAEQDLIVIPGQGRLRRTGLVKHDMDQGEHEGHTLKNSLHTIIRVATDLDKRLSVQSEFPEWVSEKIGATKSMMVTVMDYLISSQEMQHDRDNMEETRGLISVSLPKDQGRYTNDTKVDIGGISMNRIKVGDIVNYFGEKVEVLDLGNDQARVTGGGKTMNVPLSKLKQYGQGMREGKIDAAWDAAKKKVSEGSKK